MWSLLDLKPGELTAPFAVKRVYFLAETKADRGGHSHHRLNQVAAAISGSVTFIVDDEGGRREILLDRPDKGLFLGPGTWREMKNFSPDCVLVVLASEPYDEADYVRDYEEFLAEDEAMSGALSGHRED
jgi:mannose-6-phosphate isomerase-like protein (cupin superfamily)